jgi:multiple sugar transport system permease protein
MTHMAEDLKASLSKDAARLPDRAPAADERRRTPRGRSTRERKKRTADVVIYAVLAVLVVG